jgi:hypothetical protein
MAQLRQDEFLHRQPHGAFGTGKRDKNFSLRRSCDRPTHYRSGADVLIAQVAKNLAKPVEPFIEQPNNDLIRSIAG